MYCTRVVWQSDVQVPWHPRDHNDSRRKDEKRGGSRIPQKGREGQDRGTGRKNSTRLHNTWAAPKLRYYVQAGVFGKSHMQKLDRQTRAILRKHKSHESLVATERLYMTSTKGGRGITNMLHMWERAVVDKLRYLGQPR